MTTPAWLLTAERELALAEEQLRRNVKFLRWWNPFRASLAAEDANLRKSTAELRAVIERAHAWLDASDAAETAKAHPMRGRG